MRRKGGDARRRAGVPATGDLASPRPLSDFARRGAVAPHRGAFPLARRADWAIEAGQASLPSLRRTMRTIDLATWPRRKHFQKFSGFDHPHFGLCANVDMRRRPAVKERGSSLTVAIVYVLARVGERNPGVPLAHARGAGGRARGRGPVITILTPGDLFSFCPMPYTEDFRPSPRTAAERIAAARQQSHPGRPARERRPAVHDRAALGIVHQLHPPDAPEPGRLGAALRLGQDLPEGGTSRCPWPCRGITP